MVVLDRTQIEAAWAVADVLIPATATRPTLRDVDPDARWLNAAFEARRDMSDELRSLLGEFATDGDLDSTLRGLRERHRDLFDVLGFVIAGAYYMTPTVRGLIGYPGQERRPAPIELAAEELSDEIFEGAMEYSGSYRRPADFDE